MKKIKTKPKSLFPLIPGDIRTVRLIDREEAAEHLLEVEAVDGGVPRLTGTASVGVAVLDTNDNPPVIVEPLDKVLTVREKEPAGTVVARVVATDADAGENGTLVYSFDRGEAGF